MPRPLRDETPGIHHVVTRGNNRRDIYLDERDRTLFALTVKRVSLRMGWRVLAFALMRNHYHLLLSTGELGLSDGMQRLNHSYAITFNVRHGRINHLFGKRYWSRRLKTEGSVRYAARYIVQNPWRAGGSAALEQHPWTSYAATIGREFPHIALAVDDLLPFFGNSRPDALAEFVRFCRERPDPTELEEPRPVPGTVPRRKQVPRIVRDRI